MVEATPAGHKPDVIPLIVPGVNNEFNASVLAALLPQALLAVTDRLPDVKLPLNETVTVFVPCPLVILAPVGATHA